jgi:hypothetical protein
MKRREFFASLLVAPVALIPEDRKAKYMDGWRKGLIPVGVAGHDIKKGEQIWQRYEDWKKLEQKCRGLE